MNIKELTKKTGFKRQDIITTLHILNLKGKISYLSGALFASSNTCTGCRLKKGNKNAVPIN